MSIAGEMHNMLDLLQKSPLVELEMAVAPNVVPPFIIDGYESALGISLPDDYKQFMQEFGNCEISWRFKDRPAGQSPDARINIPVQPADHPFAAEDETFKDLKVIMDNWDLSLLCLRYAAGNAEQLVWYDVAEHALSPLSISFSEYIAGQVPFFFHELGPHGATGEVTPFDLESLRANIAM